MKFTTMVPSSTGDRLSELDDKMTHELEAMKKSVGDDIGAMERHVRDVRSDARALRIDMRSSYAAAMESLAATEEELRMEFGEELGDASRRITSLEDELRAYKVMSALFILVLVMCVAYLMVGAMVQ